MSQSIRSDEDGGKTLAHYGMVAGPYLVLPLLSPLTLRDGIGYVLNMDPINFFVPLLAVFSKGTEDMLNERAVTLQFDGGEDVTLDHYAAARNAYLTRRQPPETTWTSVQPTLHAESLNKR